MPKKEPMTGGMCPSVCGHHTASQSPPGHVMHRGVSQTSAAYAIKVDLQATPGSRKAFHGAAVLFNTVGRCPPSVAIRYDVSPEDDLALPW